MDFADAPEAHKLRDFADYYVLPPPRRWQLYDRQNADVKHTHSRTVGHRAKAGIQIRARHAVPLHKKPRERGSGYNNSQQSGGAHRGFPTSQLVGTSL